VLSARYVLFVVKFFFSFQYHSHIMCYRFPEPAQTTLDREAMEKTALSRCEGGPGRAFLAVKGRIGWLKGRIRL